MDEDITIINKNTRNEKIINFFVNNKKKNNNCNFRNCFNNFWIFYLRRFKKEK